MKIETKYFGQVHIEESKVIEFEHGLPGFPTESQFIILDLLENPVFQVLQSVKTDQTAFVIADPYHLFKEYEFNLDDNTVELLEINSKKDVLVFAIVSLKDPFESSTVNLQAPLVINQSKRRAKQYITNDKRHLTKTPFNSSNVKEV
ncbi:flagellar assembly protein FliW [Paraliobacillus sediminis]|uniref:flagellar assembly protein FliW n=1 Tax=Paraliobacillus sediminis TaxID=1885916 RepID=UPI000E3D047A|nr:flagellar assembly protein FliW [Paraliobacillus sediminis]